MEAIHRPQNRSWIDDSVVNVGEFCKLMNQVLLSKNGDIDSDDETNIKNVVSEDELAELEKECGLEAMKCEYQDRVEPANSINLPELTLDTIKFQDEDLTKRRSHSKYLFITYNMSKFSNFPPHKTVGSLTGIDGIPFEPINTPEVILSVQVYVPERRSDCWDPLARAPSFQVDQEFLVLGSQYLTELRDKIECVSDKAIPGDYSESPSLPPSETCKDLYKSGFFYINGTFYNDMRDPDCRNYSSPIRKWAEKANRGVGPFKKAAMESTKFLDLSFQLGYPYVYIHQGECEHLLVFSDLRMFSKHEVQNRNAYPLYVSLKPTKRIFCMVCHCYTSSWIVYDSNRLPENPFFFCKYCFQSFNYDADNQKIGNFRAYHLPDHTKLT